MPFAPANPPATGNSDLERYLFSEFERLSAEVNLTGELALRSLVAIGYGGIFGGGGLPGGDLGAGFTLIDGFTDGQVNNPVSVDQDFANNALQIDRAGVWQLNIHVTFGHDDLNSGRQTNLRVWDNTDGFALATLAIGVARNVGITSYAVSLLADFAAIAVGDDIQLQLGGGDTFTNITWETLAFSANHVSELQGL